MWLLIKALLRQLNAKVGKVFLPKTRETGVTKVNGGCFLWLSALHPASRASRESLTCCQLASRLQHRALRQETQKEAGGSVRRRNKTGNVTLTVLVSSAACVSVCLCIIVDVRQHLLSLTQSTCSSSHTFCIAHFFTLKLNVLRG